MNQAKGKSVSREELYLQVWQTPMSKLAEQYGISGNGLAKICRKLKIPYPGRGYWARKAAGKHVIQYQLQEPDADTPTEITITPYTAKVDNRPSEATQQALDRQQDAVSEITVPDRLTAPHPIIRQWTQEHQEEKRQAREQSRRTPSLSHLYAVSDPTSLDRRRYRILSALFKALEQHGFTIKSDPYKRVHFEYQGERIDFTLREKHKQVRRPLNDDEKRWRSASDRQWVQELQPTGKLIFTIKSYLERGMRQEWLETEQKRMEDLLPEIVATLAVAGPLLVERTKQRLEERRRWEEAQHQRWLAEQARQKDANQWRRFLELAQHWEQVKQARAFIQEIETQIEDPEQEVDAATLTEWLVWARQWTDTHDPLNGSASELFEQIASVEASTYKSVGGQYRL